jgi:hypothetical protein
MKEAVRERSRRQRLRIKVRQSEKENKCVIILTTVFLTRK